MEAWPGTYLSRGTPMKMFRIMPKRSAVSMENKKPPIEVKSVLAFRAYRERPAKVSGMPVLEWRV